MKYFVNGFRSHMFIEFYYRYRENNLNEGYIDVMESTLEHEYGIFKDSYTITKKVYDEVLEKHESTGSFVIDFNEGWLSRIIIRMRDDINDVVLAQYVSDYSVVKWSSSDGQYKAEIAIDVNKKNVPDNPRLFVGLMHEIQHGYEDYMRTLKGSDKIGSTALKHGYDKNIVGQYQGNKAIVSNILYFIETFERNAYIAEMVGYLKSSDKTFNNLHDVIAFLENTETYKFYQRLCMSIDSIINLKDTEKKEEVMSYFQELFNLRFIRFKHLSNFLKKKKRQIEDKFETIVPKIAYEHLRFENGTFSKNNLIENIMKLPIILS